jgi:lambda family phage portal protein
MVRKPQNKSSTLKNHPIVLDGQHGFYSALGYRSARIATREGRSYISYSGASHDERDRKNLIAQSRDFMRNNAIYKGMIERAVAYIVGNGFELQVNTGSNNIDKKIEGLWKDWFAKPEIRNLLSGGEVSRMVCREVMVAGDTSVLMTDKSIIQLFEAEQLDSRKKPFTNGIKTDEFGRPMEFRLCPWISNHISVSKGKNVKAENVLYLVNPERPSQTRGVPASQASFPMLHRINDVCDSEAIAWQLLARLSVSITREQGDQQAYTESREDPNKATADLEGDLATRLTELDYALLFHGNPGEEVKGIERNIPAKTFGDSVRMFLRLLGLPLGLPLEIILLDWTKSNYSQSRAVLQQAYQMFLFWQAKMADFFFTPLFKWKVSVWQEQELFGKRNKIKFDWIKETFPWIDQLKEAQAYATQVERGFTTHGRVCKSLGTDRAEVVERREIEVRDAIKRAKKIEEETGVEVPWQIFAGLKAAPDKAELAQTEEQEKESEENA